VVCSNLPAEYEDGGPYDNRLDVRKNILPNPTAGPIVFTGHFFWLVQELGKLQQTVLSTGTRHGLILPT
jgi:hypothetical protein